MFSFLVYPPNPLQRFTARFISDSGGNGWSFRWSSVSASDDIGQIAMIWIIWSSSPHIGWLPMLSLMTLPENISFGMMKEFMTEDIGMDDTSPSLPSSDWRSTDPWPSVTVVAMAMVYVLKVLLMQWQFEDRGLPMTPVSLSLIKKLLFWFCSLRSTIGSTNEMD